MSRILRALRGPGVRGPAHVRERDPVWNRELRRGERTPAVPSHDIGSSLSGLTGAGREAFGERDDEVAQFIGTLDDERPVE